MSYCTQCAALLSERDALRSELEDALADASHDKQQIKENTEMITALRAENERLKQEARFTAISVLPEKDAEIERLRAALKTARPFIGWAGYHPTILAVVDAALEERHD